MDGDAYEWSGWQWCHTRPGHTMTRASGGASGGAGGRARGETHSPLSVGRGRTDVLPIRSDPVFLLFRRLKRFWPLKTPSQKLPLLLHLCICCGPFPSFPDPVFRLFLSKLTLRKPLFTLVPSLVKNHSIARHAVMISVYFAVARFIAAYCAC